jgi:trimeric autotransporter adhesin
MQAFYISDQSNSAIRFVNSSGIISTLGPYTSTDPVWEFNGGLGLPEGLAIDGSGNLYVVDIGGDAVFQISPSLNAITVLGNGRGGTSAVGNLATSGSFSTGFYIACDPAGNIYVGDPGGGAVVAVNMQATAQTLLGTSVAPGFCEIVAGGNGVGNTGDGGPATSAKMCNPYGVAIDASGNLYICSQGNAPGFQLGAVIRRVDHATGIITSVAGNASDSYSGDGGPAISAGLGTMIGVGLDAQGNLYITGTGYDAWSNVRVVNMQATTQTLLGISVAPGNIATVAGGASAGYGGDGGPATSALLCVKGPWASRVDSTGNLYILDTNNFRVRAVDHTSSIITTVAGNGTAGYTGDGGAATSAEIRQSFDVVLFPTTPPPPSAPPLYKVDLFTKHGVAAWDSPHYIGVPSSPSVQDIVPLIVLTP